MICEVYKENQRSSEGALQKCTTSVVCVSYEFDLQQKKQGKIDFISTIKEVIVP